jgi:hypothetical protein
MTTKSKNILLRQGERGMKNQYAGVMVRHETWKRFDKLASKKKVNTEALIESVLVDFLTENEAITDPELMKRKIELGINEIIDFVKSLYPQESKKV